MNQGRQGRTEGFDKVAPLFGQLESAAIGLRAFDHIDAQRGFKARDLHAHCRSRNALHLGRKMQSSLTTGQHLQGENRAKGKLPYGEFVKARRRRQVIILALDHGV
jgi:hypothetical protein